MYMSRVYVDDHIRIKRRVQYIISSPRSGTPSMNGRFAQEWPTYHAIPLEAHLTDLKLAL